MREIYSKRSARKSLSLRTFSRRAESALMTSTEEAKPRENSTSRKPLPAPPAIIAQRSPTVCLQEPCRRSDDTDRGDDFPRRGQAAREQRVQEAAAGAAGHNSPAIAHGLLAGTLQAVRRYPVAHQLGILELLFDARELVQELAPFLIRRDVGGLGELAHIEAQPHADAFVGGSFAVIERDHP